MQCTMYCGGDRMENFGKFLNCDARTFRDWQQASCAPRQLRRDIGGDVEMPEEHCSGL